MAGRFIGGSCDWSIGELDFSPESFKMAHAIEFREYWSRVSPERIRNKAQVSEPLG